MNLPDVALSIQKKRENPRRAKGRIRFAIHPYTEFIPPLWRVTRHNTAENIWLLLLLLLPFSYIVSFIVHGNLLHFGSEAQQAKAQQQQQEAIILAAHFN